MHNLLALLTHYSNYILLIFLLGLINIQAADIPRHFPAGTRDVFIANTPNAWMGLLNNIAPLIENSIAQGYYPGAVILAAHRGHIIYRGVFGNRRILPNITPMRFDTIFDIASLTKVVATTTAIMQLVEQNKLALDAPVSQYWPAFAQQGKGRVTLRELLTHTSGFAPDISSPELTQLIDAKLKKEIATVPPWQGEKGALQRIEQLKLSHPPGTTLVYSDINFIVLGHLVERVSGQSLNQYTQQHIFKPLGMHNTDFLPPAIWRDRIAPTQFINHKLRWGDVHDPTTYRMGGVAGMAGLFSNASDLGIFAQCLLNKGFISDQAKDSKKNNHYLLQPLTVVKMTTPQTPKNIVAIRGLGWDMSSASAHNYGALLPLPSFGHTGWTGTSIWIDPGTQTWLIILTSRTHPTPANQNKLIADREAIANIVIASIHDSYNQFLHNTGSVSKRTLTK